MTDKKKKDIVDLNKPTDTRIIGVDVGTMNLVCAEMVGDGEISTKMIRNMYMAIEKDGNNMVDLSHMDYVESDDTIYVIGESAYNFANIFGKDVKRPMKRGLISASDVDSLDVLTLIMEQLVGRTRNGLCVYSVPAPSLDKENDILYHEGVFKRIFSELGYKAIPFNEAMAIIYSECQQDNFSGLAFSYGSGMSNTALSFRSNCVLNFSVARGGDWIDDSVARQFNTVPNRITSIKENNTDLSDYKKGSKKERMIREAIIYYYRNLITYSLDTFKRKLDNELSDVDLPEKLPIVVSGGTSKAIGFMDLFTSIVEEYDEFPFEIKSITHAPDPLTAVSEGLLIKAISEKENI